MVVLEGAGSPIGFRILESIDVVGGSGSSEVGQKIVQSVVMGLAEYGEYQTLGSPEFHDHLEDFLAKFPEGEARNGVRYSSVAWFLQEIAANIYNRSSHEIVLELSDQQKVASVDQVFQIFRQLGEVNAIMDHYPNIPLVKQKLIEISNTPLVWDRSGIFYSDNPDDLNESRSLMVLLKIRGLRRSVAESVIDIVQYTPSSGGRRMTGMLPAAMLHFPDLLHPDDRQEADFQQYVDWVFWRAKCGWPTPGGSSSPPPEAELAAYFCALQIKYYGSLMS